MVTNSYTTLKQLKGKYLIGIENNDIYRVSSVTDKFIRLEGGGSLITIMTILFYEHHQHKYTLMDSITFEGKKYPVREVVVDGVGTVLVGTESLSNALNPNGDWNNVTKEAEYIDNKIYFYVEDDEIYLPINKLTELVN